MLPFSNGETEVLRGSWGAQGHTELGLRCRPSGSSLGSEHFLIAVGWACEWSETRKGMSRECPIPHRLCLSVYVDANVWVHLHV